VTLSDRARIVQQVIARRVGEETVMLDLANGTYFSLDLVGARIWALLGEGKTLAEICDVLMAEYDVARDAIERDVLSLVEELRAHGLIVRA
jgi:hypothetical protein